MSNNNSLVLLLCVVLAAACVFITVEGADCYYSCSADADCTGTCTSCINGVCSCPNNQSVCQLRESYYTCYDASTEICCPQYFSHGSGTTCPISNVCCDSFSIKTCADPATQYCCPYGNYAAACSKDQLCCGSQYPVCYSNTTAQCCCNSFSCPEDNTCDCTNSQCIPPAVCKSTTCGGSDQCCPDYVHGESCYDSSDYDCVHTSQGFQLCPKGEGVCGETCYNRTTSTCIDGVLCGAGESTCNGVCYDTSRYNCLYGSNGYQLCSKNHGVCGSVCYDDDTYTCTYNYPYGYVLCGLGLGVCGDSCYDSTLYKCCGSDVAPTICSNHGTCTYGACQCDPNWNGTKCDECAAGYYPADSCTSYNPCAANPSLCAAGQKCVNSSDSSYSCNARQYFITSVATGFVITAGAQAANAVVDSKDSTNKKQLWNFIPSQGGYIQNVGTGLVLDINGGVAYPTTNVITYPQKPSVKDNSDDNQKWRYDSVTLAIISQLANYAIDVEYGSTDKGTPLIIYYPNNQTNQQWLFEEQDGN